MIENTDFRQETIDLSNPFDVKLVKEFLKVMGFEFDPSQLDYCMIIYNLNDQVIGTGSCQGNVLKYVAVTPKFRETTAFAQIVTHLTDLILKASKAAFVYTKPENSLRFQGLGYKEIARAEPIYALLEFGFELIQNYQEYLTSIKDPSNTNDVAAVVVNCNPFTNGHLYLIEKAASENEVVYIFVVEEDRSVFDFETRWDLIKKGTAHLNNVIMVKGGKYVVSGATFPSYFLKKEKVDLVTQKQTELDITIFAKYLVPALGIKKRYVGTENYCFTTAAYNDTMKKILPEYHVELVEVQRKSVGSKSNYISASKVRKAIKDGRLEEIEDFLPATTMEFLRSEESKNIKEKIKSSFQRH